MKKQPSANDVLPSDAELIAMGQKTFVAEAEALRQVGESLDENFAAALKILYANEGRVLITGLGKSGIVARKMAATFTSTGTPSHFIHPVEAVHGDLGVVRQGDILIAISRSGNNAEVVSLVSNCRRFGMTTMAITDGSESKLAQGSDIVLNTPIGEEACPLNLTPTSSAVAAMAMGDALATSLITLRGFKAEDFALFHPSGTLGRSLLVKVEELMHTGDELPLVSENVTLRESLPEIVDKKLGGVCVVDSDGRLKGLCVDGDVKRVLLENEGALDMPITAAMNPRPTTIGSQMMAVEALRMMQQRKRGPVTLLIVVDSDGRPEGLLHIHDVLRAGLL
ncbi:MAG: arabinose-5-phosphate isomerase [Candidatus Krumholzibacteriia bacterium]|jgi:arabinose-5-phosphate isomerase